MFSFLRIFLFASAILIISCKKSDDRKCFKTLGKIVRETRPATSFDHIFLNDYVNLILTQDTFHSILVEAPSNLINFIKTDIEGGHLSINNENKCDFLRSYNYEINVYVSLKKLSKIYFTGFGKITSTNTIITPEVSLDFWGASGSIDISLEAGTAYCNIHTGPGDFKLDGSVGVCSIYSLGTGFMHLEDLACGYAFVNNSGTGDFFINTEKEMTIEIHSLGSVFYSGNPLISYIDITGKGELIKL